MGSPNPLTMAMTTVISPATPSKGFEVTQSVVLKKQMVHFAQYYIYKLDEESLHALENSIGGHDEDGQGQYFHAVLLKLHIFTFQQFFPIAFIEILA